METKIECTAPSVRLGEKTYPCTIAVAMDLIGGKWKAVILYHLKEGEKRFRAIRENVKFRQRMEQRPLFGNRNYAEYSAKTIGKR